MLDDNRKIGMGLCSLGLALVTLGCIFLFDRAFLSLGNMSFLAGLCFLLGPEKCGTFFWRKKGPSAAFFSGFALIVYGWPFFGFLLEVYGIWKLFATFLPNVIQTLKFVPGVSTIMSLPPFSWVVDKIQSNRRLPV